MRCNKTNILSCDYWEDTTILKFMRVDIKGKNSDNFFVYIYLFNLNVENRIKQYGIIYIIDSQSRGRDPSGGREATGGGVKMLLRLKNKK